VGLRGAVPADHLLLVRELALVFHEEAVAAGELVALLWQDLDGEGLRFIFAADIEDGFVLFFDFVIGAPGEQLFETRLAYGLFFLVAHRRSPPDRVEARAL